MIKKITFVFSFLLLLGACTEGEKEKTDNKNSSPTVSNNGISIHFSNAESMSFFETETVSKKDIKAQINAPGKIVATVVPSGINSKQDIVLFNNSDLSSNYMQVLQIQSNINRLQNVNIKQKKLELERTKELHAHGSATGQDLLSAETELSIEQSNLENERAALIEHETTLNAAGFKFETLQKAKSGTAFLICHVPENQISKIELGQTATALFTAFPDETISGKIDAIADVLDNNSRMIKVSVTLNNSERKFKTGMFANVSFGLKESNFISINKSSLITIKGKHYVFVIKSADEFERREVQIGQQMGDQIIVFSGIEEKEEVAIKGVMQLKGLSFGY